MKNLAHARCACNQISQKEARLVIARAMRERLSILQSELDQIRGLLFRLEEQCGHPARGRRQ